MNWPLVPIVEVTRIVSGATPRTGKPSYWNGDISWVTPKDISDLDGSKYLRRTPRTLTTEGLSACSAEVLPPNSVLFSSRAPIGLVAINSIPVATNQGFKSFVPDSERLDAGYLYYWLKANRASLERLGVGATFKEVSKAIVSRIRVPLPPLAEQRRIAEILDRAEELRAKRRAAIALLDQLPQAIFLDMFGDPVSNPKGWPKAPLSELADARLGKMLDQKKQSSDAPLPYVGNANVQWFHLELGQLQTMTFLPREKEVLALRNGDVLICEGGEPGRAAIWRDELAECYFQKAIHRVRVDSARLTPMFLVHYLYRVAKSGGLNDYVTSATIAHLTGEKLRTLPVMLPTVDLQFLFEERIASLHNSKATQSVALEEIDALFAGLQDLMLSPVATHV